MYWNVALDAAIKGSCTSPQSLDQGTLSGKVDQARNILNHLFT